MSEVTTEKPKTNRAGRVKEDYGGGKSTLCTGCGHDSISNHIITAFYQAGIDPFDIAKMSGIGCSSKTPGYFISKASGFNSVHGRMAPVSTGAKLSSRHLHMIGVSGDGDSASIGLGGFSHLLRRNLPMVYIVMNNGVYGLTKGQFSATADKGSMMKWGEVNPFETIDLCSLALQLGCSFVARSFSGDAKQLVPLIKAGIRHNGTAFIDVLSPCVTFANHDGSTKSYTAIKDHNFVMQELGFVDHFDEVAVDYSEGSTEKVAMPDGSTLTLRKLDSKVHDVSDRLAAIRSIYESRERGEILTGLFYLNPQTRSYIDEIALTDKSLNQLDQNDLRPTPQQLTEILSEFR